MKVTIQHDRAELALATRERTEYITDRLTLTVDGDDYEITEDGGGLRFTPPRPDLAAQPVRPPPGTPKGKPRIVAEPDPKTVKCDECRSTIEYQPWHLRRLPSLPSSDDLGSMVVKCPRPGCSGFGSPR